MLNLGYSPMSLFEAFSLIVSITALVVVIWQTRALRLQMRANFHQEYTRRYIDILKNMPPGAPENKHMSLSECVSENSEFKITMRLYFWTIQEEYHLHLNNRIPKGQWKIWDEHFRIMMKNRWLQESWSAMKDSLALPGCFVDYVSEVLATSKANAFR